MYRVCFVQDSEMMSGKGLFKEERTPLIAWQLNPRGYSKTVLLFLVDSELNEFETTWAHV